VDGQTDKNAVQPTGVRFTEVMKGTITRWLQSSDVRLQANTPLALHLSVIVADLHQFLADPEHTANLSGWIDCPALGGRLFVDRGTCSFFPRQEPGRGTGLRYWLIFSDGAGRPFTMRGEKYLRAGSPGRVWADTTTLWLRLLDGRLAADESDGQESVAEGIVRLQPRAFARELTTFRSEGRSPGVRVRALLRYFGFFIGGLWDAYVPHR
jgi:cholesterol oxidase